MFMWCFEIWSRAWDLALCLCVNRNLLRRFVSLACLTWNRGTLWFSLCKMALLFPVLCHPSSALCFQIRSCTWVLLFTMSLTFRKFFEHLDMMDKVHRAHPLLHEMDLSKSMCEDVTRYVWYRPYVPNSQHRESIIRYCACQASRRSFIRYVHI